VLRPVIDREPTTPMSKTPNKSRIARKRVKNVTKTKSNWSLLDNNLIGRATERFFKDERGHRS
jgi:hypothetical protein